MLADEHPLNYMVFDTVKIFPGEILARSQSHRNMAKPAKRNGFGPLIREKRLLCGLNQKELANKLNVKVAIVRSIEKGQFNPSSRLISSIEKALDR
jgi:ribosome-binding protein aMBF1 (putative translation factor)